MATEVEKLVKVALAQGWRVSAVKGGGFKFWPPDKSKPAVSGWESGDTRALKNLRAGLKRAGLKLDGLGGFAFFRPYGGLVGHLFGG